MMRESRGRETSRSLALPRSQSVYDLLQPVRRTTESSTKKRQHGNRRQSIVSAVLAPNVPVIPALPESNCVGGRRVIIIGEAQPRRTVVIVGAAADQVVRPLFEHFS